MPDPKDFSKIYLDMIERDLSPSYIANIIKMANHFCDFSGVERPSLKPPKNTRKRIVYLTEIEAKRLLHACTDIRYHSNAGPHPLSGLLPRHVRWKVKRIILMILINYMIITLYFYYIINNNLKLYIIREYVYICVLRYHSSDAMKRKHICIPVIVLMICALFPGMMISGDCESCNTEDVRPYTAEELRESILEAEEKADVQYKEILEEIESLYTMLYNPPLEKDEKLSALISSFYNDYILYLRYVYQKTEGEVLSSMTSESEDGYLLITKAEPVDTFDMEQSLVHRDELQRRIGAKYDILRSYYNSQSDEKIDYCAILDDMLALYDELTEVNIRCATLMIKFDVLMQAEKQEIFTGSTRAGDCDTPGPADSLYDNCSTYMSGFTWVKAWVGAYSSVSPEGAGTFIGQYCTATCRTLDQHLAYALLLISPATQSIQVKYFFTVYEGTHKHNAIYEGNKSRSNINGYYTVGGASVYFTNGAGWTYGGTYDGSSVPSNGHYVFDVNEGWLICCDGVDEWCNTHCSSCFACDVGADQNFIKS